MSALVMFTRCEPCMYGMCVDPPAPHPWMGKDDADHAGVSWPLSQEDANANPCACTCAGGPGGCVEVPDA